MNKPVPRQSTTEAARHIVTSLLEADWEDDVEPDLGADPDAQMEFPMTPEEHNVIDTEYMGRYRGDFGLKKPKEEPLDPALLRGGTLVLHLSDRSTDFLTTIYAGQGYTIVNHRIGRENLRKVIDAHDRIFMLGHGCSQGLFGPGYLIDGTFAPLLRDKPGNLYIWCHADDYVKYHGLSGLSSGMFISEVGEAAMYGIRATQAQVDKSNNAFSEAVRAYLDGNEPPQSVAQRYCDAACKITKYNREKLQLFSNGNPTPLAQQDPTL